MTGRSPASRPVDIQPAPPLIGDDWIADIRQRLLDHFDTHARDLPWRASDDPYAVWVSEVMLQQTRVATVEERYSRWMDRFPTLDALAAADVDDVLHEWQGLGYYARARNLHRAATVVMERHGGTPPSDATALRELPGVGEYTAGAVASIAYGQRVPAVDGNVRRVLSRLVDADLGPAALRDLADRLVPAERPGDFNQALMELGATICTPRAPRCLDCPIASHCAARASGREGERPARKRRGDVPEYDVAALIVVDDSGRLLLRQRPVHGMLAGLWELPCRFVTKRSVERVRGRGRGGDTAGGAARGRVLRDGHSRTRPTQAVRSSVRKFAASLIGELLATSARAGRQSRGADQHEPAFVTSLRHVFSHRVEIYHAFRVTLAANGPVSTPEHHVFAASRDLSDLAMPAAQRRLARLALE